MHSILAVLSAALVLPLGGCASLLPRGQAQTIKPWASFDQAHMAYEHIQPFKTTTGSLREMGIDPAVTPNITILNYADIIRRLLPPSGSDIVLDPGIRACLEAQGGCRGYEIDQRHTDRRRVGNFWLDFLDFRRETTRNPLGPLQGLGESGLGRLR